MPSATSTITPPAKSKANSQRGVKIGTRIPAWVGEEMTALSASSVGEAQIIGNAGEDVAMMTTKSPLGESPAFQRACLIETQHKEKGRLQITIMGGSCFTPHKMLERPFIYMGIVAVSERPRLFIDGCDAFTQNSS